MRNILLAAGALGALMVGAPEPGAAADVRAPRATAECWGCDWNGYYVGFNLGASRDTSTSSDSWTWYNNYPTGTLIGIGGGQLFTTTAPLTTATSFSNGYHHGAPGLIGGLQAGYNWQRGRGVVGFEADFSGAYQKDSTTYAAQPVTAVFPPLPNFFFAPGTTQAWNSEQKLDWLSTVRLRLGWAHGPYMWYATGGGAVAQIESRYTLMSTPGFTGNQTGTFGQWGLPGGIAGQNFTRTRIGWTVGGGVETAIGDLFGLRGLGNRFTMKLEYLYVDLGRMTNVIATGLVPVCASNCSNPATGSTLFISSVHASEQIVRLGFNYKYDTAPVPMVYK